MGSAMADNDVQDWAEIEASYWSNTIKNRAEEDRVMVGKFEDKTGPMRRQLALLFDQREELTKQLQDVKRKCDHVEADLDGVSLQFEEAKQIMAADRERKDESARAWFNYNKARTAQPQPQQNGTGPRQNGYAKTKGMREGIATGPRASCETPDRGGFTTVNENGNGNGHVDKPASDNSSPLSEPPDVSPPDNKALAGAEIYDFEGNRVHSVKRMYRENKFIRQMMQIPIQRHAVVRPGRKFTQETIDSIYEPSDAKGAKWLSCMIQATGEEQETPCTSCVNRAGTWVGCVIVGGEDFPRCANCEWNRQGCTGSSYHQIRSRDDDLPQMARNDHNSPFLGDHSILPSREGSSFGGFTPVNSGLYRPAGADAFDGSSSVPSRRKSLPSKKGGRKSLPNMAIRHKEDGEPMEDPILGREEAQSVEPVDPGPVISMETLVLRDNGVEFTEPEIMRGVPLERITPEHPYWDPKWEVLDQVTQQKLDSWRRKLEECLALNKNRFLAGRQVNRGNTIMTFLQKTDFHPYQLVGKKWITKGLMSYDTIFRLAQVIEELPKLGVDVTPVAWVRQRMHELYMEQGEEFSLAKTVHELYHDPKLRALRTKAGVGNIGRPSGVKKGMTSKEPKAPKAKGHDKDPANGTPYKKRRRQSSGSLKHELKQEEQTTPTMSPRSAKKQRPDSRPQSSGKQDTEPVAAASPSLASYPPSAPAGVTQGLKPTEGELAYDGYTSTDSFSGDHIMQIDFRVSQLKTTQHTTNISHTQYWHWVSDKAKPYFEHQVLRTVEPAASWGVYKEPLDFHLRLHELDYVEYSLEPGRDCTKIVVHTKPAAKLEYRGIVMAYFKRQRTVKRFLGFIQKKGVPLVKRPADYIEQQWASIESTVLPRSEDEE
ncbi:hypothetical protein KVR01_004484 [Diaporthe batatas]|uniref:uncharacterized protein n=1 Tax=Diaporthe batatas TaxID=748121 RepID=UPI001D044B35|nr:uncharacterized protein KVR01_004484 [Diaporthe batatas]KAG8165932.1 hypothetical protein KVR01_004484 [Diaporthe batatas]